MEIFNAGYFKIFYSTFLLKFSFFLLLFYRTTIPRLRYSVIIITIIVSLSLEFFFAVAENK